MSLQYRKGCGFDLFFNYVQCAASRHEHHDLQPGTSEYVLGMAISGPRSTARVRARGWLCRCPSARKNGVLPSNLQWKASSLHNGSQRECKWIWNAVLYGEPAWMGSRVLIWWMWFAFQILCSVFLGWLVYFALSLWRTLPLASGFQMRWSRRDKRGRRWVCQHGVFHLFGLHMLVLMLVLRLLITLVLSFVQ